MQKSHTLLICCLYYHIICLFQAEIAIYDENWRCSGGLLALYLAKNYGASQSACQTLVDHLKQRHLDPLIKNLTPETDFRTIESAFKTLVLKYKQSCVGPASDDVFHTFVQVSIIM